jgi:hypothetical protein
MPPDPDYQFLYQVIVNYINGLFEKDREARNAALHALETSQRNAASKVEFYIATLVALAALVVAIIKK